MTSGECISFHLIYPSNEASEFSGFTEYSRHVDFDTVFLNFLPLS